MFFVDNNGVYSIEDNWKNVSDSQLSPLSSVPPILSASEAISHLEAEMDITIESETAPLVYSPYANGVYKLSYEVHASDGQTYIIDAENGTVL